jgi:hypothetical protein
MAQTQLLPMAHTAIAGSFTTEELHEIRECERLVRFRDEVLSGNHPRIKPAYLTAKSASTDSRSSSNAQAARTEASATGNRQAVVDPEHLAQSNTSTTTTAQTGLQSYSVHSSYAVPGLGSLPGSGNPAASSSRPFISSGSTEINPILLEKSADLVKAEMHHKRQRLEHALRGETDQRRVSAKAILQASESLSLPDFDLADVLSKAQTLVPPTSVLPTDDTAANASASSDSFDDNTFYSSQHDTPEFQEEEPRAPNKSPADIEMREESDYEPEYETPPMPQNNSFQNAKSSVSEQHSTKTPVQNNIAPTNIPTGPRADRMNGLETRQTIGLRIPGLQTAQAPSGNAPREQNAEASRLQEARNVDKQQAVHQHAHNDMNREPLGDALGRPPSPLIRAHNLSPIAPQPAHVSPLAVARQPPAAQLDDSIGRRATPAQVAALRKQPSAGSSPDGSPRDSTATEKKGEKKKKKKRKSDRLAVVESAGATASPYIKNEPRSPSPMSAPAYARPNKRLRQEQRLPGASDYDEARYDQPLRVDHGYAERYEPRRAYVEERYPPSQRPRFDDHIPPRQVPPPASGDDRAYHKEFYDLSHPSPSVSTEYARPGSPGAAFPGHYVPNQARVVRSVSHAVLEGPYHDGPAPVQYSGARDGRMSVRPVVDRERSRSPIAYERHASAMPPPRAPVRRIIVDEYGREYIEPPRPHTVVRPSAVPVARREEPEVIYERTVPVRAVSRHHGLYEGEGLPYGQPSPSYPSGNAPYPRRVVTQPEMTAGPDYRAYRERDYVPRPMDQPVDEFLPRGAEMDSRRIAEVPRDYVVRAASVRPAGEVYRYDMPGGYSRRIVEEVPREFASARAASVRPVESQRYEVPHGYERRAVDMGQYGVVPARTASVRPAEPMQYEAARDPGWGVGSVRPSRDYAASVMPETPREMLPPAARAYSVRPAETMPSAAAVRQEYHQPALRPADGYYGHAPAQDDQEVTYVDQRPRQDAYQGPRHH